MEQSIEESCIETALVKCHEMKADTKREYYFDQASFNSLGYHLMGQSKVKEAIEIFKMNVEMYPESWNVYDSLGEAYMKNGDKESAIQNYKKSLELNAENENGKMMLKRLVGE